MSMPMILFGILGTILVGAISPGPSFVLVSRVSAKASRTDGLAAALGMGLGGAVFATLALFGLAAVLLHVEWLYLVLRVAGGLYLVYLGIRIWRGASEPLAVADPAAADARSDTVFRSFAIALLTQLSNPKAAIVYASIFAALLPPTVPVWLLLSLPPLVFLVEASWYTVVALAFSAEKPRSLYLRAKLWVDRLAGAVLGALGARLVWEGLLARR